MLADNIVYVFSGEEYMVAVSSLQILSVSLIFATRGCFFINVILIPYRMENIVLITTIISATVNIILNFFLIPLWGSNATAFTTLISEIIMARMGFLWGRKYIKIKAKRGLFCAALNGFIAFAVCYGVKMLSFGLILTMMLSVVGAVLLCFAGFVFI